MNIRDDDEDGGLDSDEMSDTPSELELIGHTTPSGGEVRVKGRKRSIFRKIRRHSQTVYRKCRELVGTGPEERNWKGIGIALLVILIVCSLIVTAVILVSPKIEEKIVGNPFTYDDAFNSEFRPNLFEGSWVGDSDVFVYRNNDGALVARNAENKNKTRIIVTNTTFNQLNTNLFFVSPELDFVLIGHNIKDVFRHSFLAYYSIFNILTKKLVELVPPLPAGSTFAHHEIDRSLQLVQWAPKGRALSFVYKNNLYYKPRADVEAHQLTTSGGLDILNGISDWLYEEEVLHTTSAHWWSTGATYICYATINDTNVPKVKIPRYDQSTYTRIEEIPYPKAGDSRANIIPVIEMRVVNVRNYNVKHVPLLPPAEFRNKEHYVSSVTWRDDQYVVIVWLNRAQNHSIITLCDAKSGECQQSLREKSTLYNGPVILDTPYFSTDKQVEKPYFVILPELDGSAGHFKHVAKITTSEDVTKTFLTDGQWDVTKIVGYDDVTSTLFFESPGEDPRKMHLYSVGTEEMKAENFRVSHCLTCEMAEDCQYVSTKFSSSGKFYILECQGPGVPYVLLRSTIKEYDEAIVLEDNSHYKKMIKDRAMPKVEFFELEMEDGMKFWGRMSLPPVLKKDHVIKYPLVLKVYGGPGTQEVTLRYKIPDWTSWLTSSQNIIYASVDVRGTSGRGLKFMNALYQKFGDVEVKDTIAAAKLMRDFKFVDKEKMCIFGWSYGGFVTAKVLETDSGLFKCGIAVAPVTDWRYYDAAYTERFMKTPKENWSGYDNASLMKKVRGIKNSHLLLIHGTADDNVHFQNSAVFMKALTEAEVEYRTQIYADKTHALKGDKTRQHLYKTISRYIKEHIEFIDTEELKRLKRLSKFVRKNSE